MVRIIYYRDLIGRTINNYHEEYGYTLPCSRFYIYMNYNLLETVHKLCHRVFQTLTVLEKTCLLLDECVSQSGKCVYCIWDPVTTVCPRLITDA